MVSFLIISNFIVAQKRSLGQFTHDIPGIFSVMLSGVGPAYLFGDVGGRIEDQIFLGSTDWDMTKTRFLYSIGFRQHFPNNFGLKGTLAYGQFAGTDEGTSNPTRGYSFTSDITEISHKANTLCTEDPTPYAALQILCMCLPGLAYSAISQNLSEMVDHALSTL